MIWFLQSHLFELARRGKRLTHILAILPLASVFALVAQFGALPVLIILATQYGFTEALIPLDQMTAVESGFWMALFLISAFILIYVFTGLWVWLFEKRPFWTLGYERSGALGRYLRGLLAGAVLFSSAVGILALAGGLTLEAGDPSQQGIPAIGGVLIVLVGWVVQGGAEELLTRGWLLPVAGARYRPWLGLVVSSLFFAGLHSWNAHLSLLALANLALFGVFAGLYALREGSLWGISALHSAWNWVQGNFFGFDVSGQPAGGGTLINLAGRGPDWLTGGGFGPEGGIAVTAVLLLGILGVIFWRNRSTESLPVRS